ncbi:MAG: hypothetical protein H0V09_11505, partial [Gemmatimonadetes bacterium]|nr:hypothetical protein [Gemmatimonadota bacterium]
MRCLPSAPALLALALLATAGLRAPVALAQTLTIPEYRELVLANEGKLTRIDREIAVENARLDRLVSERNRGDSPGGEERAGQLSGRIVKVSNRLAELERLKRSTQAELRRLRTALDERYTAAIDGSLDRLGAMAQSDPAYARLYLETSRYIGARDSLQLQIRIGETLRNFREFPILLTDGPAEIREKAGFYRDYVRDVDARLAALEGEMRKIQDRDRVSERMREFREDLAFQGADAPDRPG